jgi:DNA-binding NtrC family response regulator
MDVGVLLREPMREATPIGRLGSASPRAKRSLAGLNAIKAEAARRLGIHRRLLYEKLKAFGLGSGSEEQADS